MASTRPYGNGLRKQIAFRVTDEEYAEIATEAAAKGLSIAEAARIRVFGASSPIAANLDKQLSEVEQVIATARRALGGKE